MAATFYKQIAAIYQGDLMAEELYEDWSTMERENLKEIYLVSLEKISPAVVTPYYGAAQAKGKQGSN